MLLKLMGIHIYGYGQLENVKINNLSSFQVIFGGNEAGKSTMMAFIHGVLFGFPTKQQSELRYEPKHNSKYGGKVILMHEEMGQVVIERVKGKAAGDVKVVLESGAVGGEELLQQVLGNFDKNLFQAIFSFNIHGLQNIQQMKGEDLGRFLFSAGTLGTELLSTTENVLQKELDQRFKPSGKKPSLNEKLAEVQGIQQDLKKALSKTKDYETLVGKREQIRQEIDDINLKLRHIHNDAIKLNEWKRIGSFVKEKKWIEQELNHLGEIDFPPRGIERLEKLMDVIHPYQAELGSMTARIEETKQELSALSPDEPFLENEHELISLLDRFSLYEQWQLEKQQYETKLSICQEKIDDIKSRLHLSLNEGEILSINTNIYMKNQVETLARKTERLSEIKRELDSQYQEEKKALESIEIQHQTAKNLCLPEHERNRIKERLQRGTDRKGLEMELQAVQEQIKFYQYAEEQEKAAKSRLRVPFILVAVILAGLALYGLFTEQWILLILGAAGFIGNLVLLWQINKKPKKRRHEQSIEGLRENEKQVLQQLQSSQLSELAALEEKLKQDDRRRDQLQLLQFKLKQQEEQFEKVIRKFEEWEQETAINKQKLIEISRELRIPPNMAKSFLSDSFELIEQAKTLFKEKQQLLQALEQIKQQETKVAHELNQYEIRFLSKKTQDLHRTVYQLRIKLKEEHEKLIKFKERSGRLSDLEQAYRQKAQELNHLLEEKSKLLQSANVTSEQQFYELGESAEKQKLLHDRLLNTQSQFQYTLLTEEEQEKFLHLHNEEELLAEYNQNIQHLQAKVKHLQEEHASVLYEIQVLEEGGIYSDVLHHFKQKKFELDQAAKEWAIYSIAQDILKTTIEKYKSNHLPRMLAKAEEYLSFLTNGNYQRIYPEHSGTGFLIERKDHTLFTADELSQATAEQLYVSIRLSLATTIYEKYPFPIIIDDSFVNFDKDRTEMVIKLLQTLEKNQILFFTCHSHLLTYFDKRNILYLKKGTLLEYVID